MCKQNKLLKLQVQRENHFLLQNFNILLLCMWFQDKDRVKYLQEHTLHKYIMV